MGLITALFALIVSFDAFAYGPCDADAEKLCATAHHGETTKVCLHKNAEKVSEDCRAFLKKEEKGFQDREKSLGQVRQACKDDITKFCAESRDSDKPLTVCLMGSGEKLQESCKTDVNRHIRDHLPGIRQIGEKE